MMQRTLLLAIIIGLLPISYANAGGLTGEVRLSRLSWLTDGNELNRSGLSFIFNREIEINTLAIDTFLGYRFDHNRSIATAVGFIYGRGLAETEVQEFGRGNRYRFKSWFGFGYKGFYNILAKPNLDLFWHLSLIDFNLDAEQFVDGAPESTVIQNGTFSGWGYGLGFTITQFMISYNIYSLNLGLCNNCPDTQFHSISLGWQFN